MFSGVAARQLPDDDRARRWPDRGPATWCSGGGSRPSQAIRKRTVMVGGPLTKNLADDDDR